jgi:lipid II isoglutaminyl synthase (glutamine-hydrolysing)
MRVLCGHLYPDYLNIYADRGNIAVLERRAGWRGIDFEIVPIGMAGAIPADVDLLYVGGGQDREQALIAADLASRGAELSEAIASGTALLAVCGGYQLLGRYYRDRSGRELPGADVLPLWTEAGDRRMIGDILLDCDLPGAGRRTLAGFENHGGRTYLEPGADALGRVVAGFGNNGEDGLEGCRYEGAIGTYLHGPLLPRNPWLADWLIARALAHRLGRPPELEPLPDELERRAHEVAAGRARGRGGRYS